MTRGSGNCHEAEPLASLLEQRQWLATGHRPQDGPAGTGRTPLWCQANAKCSRTNLFF